MNDQQEQIKSVSFVIVTDQQRAQLREQLTKSLNEIYQGILKQADDAEIGLPVGDGLRWAANALKAEIQDFFEETGHVEFSQPGTDDVPFFDEQES